QSPLALPLSLSLSFTLSLSLSLSLSHSVCISVACVSHLTRSFALSILPTRVERAKEATANMGSAVSTTGYESAPFHTHIDTHTHTSYIAIAPGPFPISN